MNRYYKGNPIVNKTIAKDCEDIFCKTYMDKIRFACAINTDGNKIFHIVKIGGKQSVIILTNKTTIWKTIKTTTTTNRNRKRCSISTTSLKFSVQYQDCYW